MRREPAALASLKKSVGIRMINCGLTTRAFVLQSLDKALLVVGCVYIWFRQSKKAGAPSGPPSSTKDEGTAVGMPPFEPAVVVQIPMCNERECYRQSITAACRLDWPQDKLVIQVHTAKTPIDLMPLQSGRFFQVRWCASLLVASGLQKITAGGTFLVSGLKPI